MERSWGLFEKFAEAALYNFVAEHVSLFKIIKQTFTAKN